MLPVEEQFPLNEVGGGRLPEGGGRALLDGGAMVLDGDGGVLDCGRMVPDCSGTALEVGGGMLDGSCGAGAGAGADAGVNVSSVPLSKMVTLTRASRSPWSICTCPTSGIVQHNFLYEIIKLPALFIKVAHKRMALEGTKGQLVHQQGRGVGKVEPSQTTTFTYSFQTINASCPSIPAPCTGSQ